MNNKIEMYLVSNRKYFPDDKLVFIKNQLLSLNEDQLAVAISTELKDPTIILLLSVIVGHWGVDRFMIGHIGMGIFKALTLGGLGTVLIYDWCTISTKTKELNYKNLVENINLTRYKW